MKENRINKIDNIKTLLIFLVVFGHLCEKMSFPFSRCIYLIIYAFHMPTFVFISGYCCNRKTCEQLIIRFVLPYIIFQTLYIAFSKYVLLEDQAFQYTTPYWILWYLMAIFWWNIFILAFGEIKEKILFISILVALLVGYDKSIGYYLSLSRTIVLFPFFAAGYYFKCNNIMVFHLDVNNNRKIVILAETILLTLLVCYCYDSIQTPWVYHSYSYASGHYNIFIRAILMMVAWLYIIFLCVFSPNIKLRLCEYVGKHTLNIFILHGFLVRYLVQKDFLEILP